MGMGTGTGMGTVTVAAAAVDDGKPEAQAVALLPWVYRLPGG